MPPSTAPRARKDALRRFAVARGLSAEAIASSCGVAPRTARDWLAAGGPAPSVETLFALAWEQDAPELAAAMLPDSWTVQRGEDTRATTLIELQKVITQAAALIALLSGS